MSPFSSESSVESGPGLADKLLQHVLCLLKKEVAEHSRHLVQYFGLFYQYASFGAAERAHLLRLDVATTFITVAVDDGPGPPIKYQYADFSKLYAVVSLLVRSVNVSARCSSAMSEQAVMPNPYAEDPGNPVMNIQVMTKVADLLYSRQNYIKKLMEDANSSEDTVKLFKFLSWENPSFSFNLLNELLCQIAYAYAYELKPHLDLLLHMLLIEDSWQTHRIHNSLKGNHRRTHY